MSCKSEVVNKWNLHHSFLTVIGWLPRLDLMVCFTVGLIRPEFQPDVTYTVYSLDVETEFPNHPIMWTLKIGTAAVPASVCPSQSLLVSWSNLHLSGRQGVSHFFVTVSSSFLFLSWCFTSTETIRLIRDGFSSLSSLLKNNNNLLADRCPIAWWLYMQCVCVCVCVGVGWWWGGNVRW